MIEQQLYLGDLCKYKNQLVEICGNFTPDQNEITIATPDTVLKVERYELFRPSILETKILNLEGWLSVSEEYNGINQEQRQKVREELRELYIQLNKINKPDGE